MNDIISKFLLAGDTFLSEMHLREPGFTCSACGSISMICLSKRLAKRTTADKVIRDKAFNIAKDPKYDGYERGLASIVYKFLDKKTKGTGVTIPANKSFIKFIP